MSNPRVVLPLRSTKQGLSRGNHCPLPSGSRVWAYLRVSGEEQADRGLPIAGQRQRAEDYAAQHGLAVVRWFVDEARSGASTERREAFNEMIDLSRQKAVPVDGILVWDLKRFARNILDSQFYKADLRRRGFTLIFLSDDIPETDFAPVYEALLEWKAQRDRADIAKDAQRGLQLLARAGYAPGGFPPRGYKAEVLAIEIEGKKRQVRRWVPDPERWDAALRAWEMRAAGASLEEVFAATHLFATQGCFSTFFSNRTYLGIRKCGDLEIEGAHEALITPELWDAVQKRRQRQKAARHSKAGALEHPRRANTPFLLSGLLRCGKCGSAMIGSNIPDRHMPDGHRRAWRYYICGRKTRETGSACTAKRIKAERVERAVLDALIADVLTVDRLDDMLAETNAALSGHRGDLQERESHLQLEIRRLDAAIARLLDALERGESASVRDRLTQRENERAQLTGELQGVQERLGTSQVSISRAALAELASDMRDVLQHGDTATCRKLLQAFVVRLEATGEGGVVYYTPPFVAATGLQRVPPREFESLSQP